MDPAFICLENSLNPVPSNDMYSVEVLKVAFLELGDFQGPVYFFSPFTAKVSISAKYKN